MKSLSFIISLILILVNILAGVILKDYHQENVILSSCVILINALLLWLVASCNIKDGFKVSYHVLFPIIGLIEFILAIVAPSKWDNNFYIVGIIAFIAFQTILLLAAIKSTQHNN